MTAKLPSFNSRQVISIPKRCGFALNRNLNGLTSEEIALVEGANPYARLGKNMNALFGDRAQELTRWDERIPLTDRYHCGDISKVIEGAPAGPRAFESKPNWSHGQSKARRYDAPGMA